MADSEEPKKTRGRPKKKTSGSKRTQNVPSENQYKAAREKGRKKKNYLAKKRSSEAFDPGDEAGGVGVDTGYNYHHHDHHHHHHHRHGHHVVLCVRDT